MSDPEEVSDSARARDVSYPALAFALMGGAVAWLVRLIGNAALVPYSCEIGASWPLWLTTGAGTAVASVALVVAWRFSRLADDGPRSADTARWLGLLGIAFNLTSIAGIVLESAPIAVLDVCGAVAGT